MGFITFLMTWQIPQGYGKEVSLMVAVLGKANYHYRPLRASRKMTP